MKQGKLLIDHEKGEADFRFGGWVAFRENRMECLLAICKTGARTKYHIKFTG